ncbi:hypothetical protein E4U42_003502 [Claviceps africana]|uniref:Uncharacterized protein n=1 Tax=Claviceps africana TaxID=83212 RepID=A0A8K0J7T1_9HYPO|nr:hypothetical protein E4U42_003502 [Claviceps africana]
MKFEHSSEGDVVMTTDELSPQSEQHVGAKISLDGMDALLRAGEIVGRAYHHQAGVGELILASGYGLAMFGNGNPRDADGNRHRKRTKVDRCRADMSRKEYVED